MPKSILCIGMQDLAIFEKLDNREAVHYLESVFIFSLVWSIGCTGGDLRSREIFDTFIRTAVDNKLETFSGPSGEM